VRKADTSTGVESVAVRTAMLDRGGHATQRFHAHPSRCVSCDSG
jgi:hypothetical protein